MKSDNLKLSVENEQLRSAVLTGGGVGGKDSTAAQLTIAGLEKKLLAQQEELTELHKRKGENSQLIVDLNIKMEKHQKLLAEKEHRYYKSYILKVQHWLLKCYLICSSKISLF